MRKALLALFLSSSILLSGCGAMFKSSVTSPAGSSRLTAYEGEQLSIDYPGDWTIAVDLPDQVTFQAPVEPGQDLYREWLNIDVAPFATRQITNEALREATLEGIDTDHNHEISDARSIELAGIPAYQVIFRDKHEGWDFIVLKIIAVYDRTAYTFQFAAEEQRYNEYFPTIESMLNSFQAK